MKTYKRIVFFLTLAMTTGMGACLHQNLLTRNYAWAICDVIILILLYVNAYLYAQSL